MYQLVMLYLDGPEDRQHAILVYVLTTLQHHGVMD